MSSNTIRNKHEKLQQHYQHFSSPIISPNNELGYYLHIPPFDYDQDQPRLAIASIDGFNDELPKIYEIRPLCQDNTSPPPLLSPSINTSASTFEEIKLAERQIFQQRCPETFDILQSVYNPESNRHFHFNKLKQMMNYCEICNNNNPTNSENSSISADHIEKCRNFEEYYSANSLPGVPTIAPPPRHSSKSHCYSTTIQSFGYPRPTLQRYDSSKIVRYTLVDKELSHNNSTSSNYHQRLNEYDNNTHPATNDSQSTKQSFDTNYNPPPSSYHPTLHPRLFTDSYYDYWTTSNSSSYSRSRDSRGSSQYQTTSSNYSSMYNQRNKQFLYELGYRPNQISNVINNNNAIIPIDKQEIDFFLCSPKQKSADLDSKIGKKSETLWRPYFTYLTTLIMLAYFSGCLIKNYQLTGNISLFITLQMV
jgi:hypothetical protein